jgi:hypothetical protein
VSSRRPQARAEHRDRALALVVDVDEGPALRLRAEAALDLDAELLEPSVRAVAGLVVTKGGEQAGAAGELHQLDRRHGPAAAGLLERALGVDDLARVRDVRHLCELAPLHVPDDRDAHGPGACHVA